MNILDSRILLKRSTTAGVIPTIPATSSHTDGTWVASDIYSGETFVNTVDKRAFVRLGSDIKEIPLQNHYIGESYGGGVVFHTYKGADNLEHGLIVSIVNQSTSSVYSNIDNADSGAISTWDGQSNTNFMKAQTGATSGAWKDADDYTYSGFSDWYLPSIDELSLLSTNRFNVNKTLSTIGSATQILNDSYWSSTQYSNTSAIFFTFYNKQASSLDKYYTFNVRAIRKY